jgi:DNA replication and repair protein RecF
MKRLELERLHVRSLRVLSRVDMEPAPRLNVIWGNNGHGKTSLLEAIYFVATSRSFRTSRAAELVRHGDDAASVRARFVERGTELGPLAREQTAAAAKRGVVVQLDGNRPRSLVEYATRSPVVAFHPEELGLSSGPAQGRRTLLDRLALFMDPASVDARARYARALKARHELLRRGAEEAASDTRELDAFESLCAEHGAALTRARAAAAALFVEELAVAFAQIAAPEVRLEARYAPGGSPDAAEARLELERGRKRDAFRHSAGFGPHRDELELLLDGHPARVVASQGQHRALTLALKAAETATIAKQRGIEPLLLLDDVSSELDPERTGALFSFLGLHRGQVFLTTTRPELIRTPDVPASERRDFRIVRGELDEGSG